MKLAALIWLEIYKQKKGWIWLFLFVIPAGTTLAMFLDFSIRYDYLLDTAEPGYTSWDLLLLENHRILGWGIFLPMFIGIIYAIIYHVEESQNNWKQILSLPVRRGEVYFSKFLAGLFYSVLLILLNMLGLVLVGNIMGFPEQVDWGSYGIYVGKQMLMILAVASLHNWLSSFFKNKIISIVIGFAGVIFSTTLIFQFPDVAELYPYAFTFFTDGLVYEEISEVLSSNFILMAIFLFAGMWQFKQKDIL
ncbi:ABC transporter permease [Ornithinibacillus salinisoli]|uniref:ABC transporter permease n=1 Tax=Ornithinibacillus salinisoli TaxID=1848459 RepID=A0ABW4VZN8_9BACI